MLTAGLLTEPIPMDPTGLLNTREMAGAGAFREPGTSVGALLSGDFGAITVTGGAAKGGGGAKKKGKGLGLSGLTHIAAYAEGEYKYSRKPTLCGIPKYLVLGGRTDVVRTMINPCGTFIL